MAIGAKPGTKYKKSPKDYRDETADYVISTGRPVREVARELGLAGSTLGDWVKRRREARGAVIDYVELYYNRARPHSTIGYQVPAERMGAFLARAERAFSEEVVPLESAA